MNELAFNQLVRGLKFVGFKSKSTITMRRVEMILRGIENYNLIGSKTIISKAEYNHLIYRFGIVDGKVKSLQKASEYYNMPVERIKEEEIRILQKLKLYLERVV